MAGKNYSFLKKNILFILCLILTGQYFSPISAQNNRPKIGLVLSGGGAKGVAHVGVLKVLEEADIPIDYICGTSMGAIVGGLYSIGYSAEELDSIIRAQNWMSLFTDKINRTHQSYLSKMQNDTYLLSIPFSHKQKLQIAQPTGIMKGQSILNKLSTLTLGYHDVPSFGNLPIPFTCIAADLVSGNEVILDQGSLPLAMRTSMSVPGFFEPVKKDSMILIDGGVLNNFPVDVAKKMGADIIIGVDLSCEEINGPKYSSLLDIANRIAFLSGENKYSENKKKVDIYINPELKGFESVDFKSEAIDTMITMGENAARKSLDKIIRLKDSLHLTRANKHPHHELIATNDSTIIGDWHIEGLGSYNEDWLKRKVGVKNNTPLYYADIDNIIWTLQGLGIFKTVSYKVIQNMNHDHILVVYVEEKERGSINIGMHLDTEDVASALLQSQIGFGEKSQHKISVTTKINQNPWLSLKYSRNNHKMRSLSMSYHLAYKDFRLKDHGERIDNINFLKNNFNIAFKDYSFKNFRYEAEIHYDIFSNISELYTPNYTPYKTTNEDYAGAQFRIDYDTTDDKETPKKGTNWTINLVVYGNDLLNSNKNCFGAASFNFEAAIPMGRKFTILPEFYGRVLMGNDIPGYFSNYVGGEYNNRYLVGQHAFYGIHFTEIIENSMLGGTLNLRYEIAPKHYIACIGNVIANSHHFKHIFKEGSAVGGAIKYTYNSIIGPISASFDYSDRSNALGFFASIGYFF